VRHSHAGHYRFLKGWTLEQNRELAKVTSGAISRIADTSLQGIHVMFENVPRAD
jgi:phenylpyruvate tautomerase PptA (4-oxalocrotonate tautomerase family)